MCFNRFYTAKRPRLEGVKYLQMMQTLSVDGPWWCYLEGSERDDDNPISLFRFCCFKLCRLYFLKWNKSSFVQLHQNCLERSILLWSYSFSTLHKSITLDIIPLWSDAVDVGRVISRHRCSVLLTSAHRWEVDVDANLTPLLAFDPSCSLPIGLDFRYEQSRSVL